MVNLLLPGTTSLRLEAHPTARNKAVAASDIPEGSTIISITSLTTVLLPSEKGRRCDTCHRLSSERRPLRRCTGCGSYWYCDVSCQNIQWKAHHRKVCKEYNHYTSSNAFQSLGPHEKLDSLLLTHLVAQMSGSPSTNEPSSPIAIFRSLLPGPLSDVPIPPVCSLNPPASVDFLEELYSRFGNNNFAIHSHLTTFGHGIFPLASRLFNHSCVPNAVAKYILSSEGPVTMEVVTLRDISPGEEVCLPYLDPALHQSRQQIFELTYGFRCTCVSCQSLENLGPIPHPPKSSQELSVIASALRAFVGVDNLVSGLPSRPRDIIPSALLCVFHETYLSDLSETFSKSSHEGQYVLACDAGVTLLAAYILIYPPNYPQIGMHLLELAKTMWNMIVSTTGMGRDAEEEMKNQVRVFLGLGRKVLAILGPEGDDYGPLQEAETLQSLLED